MWLTAFITKCFAQAEILDMKYKNILPVDTNIIVRAAYWMISQQAEDGSFPENGKVFNKNLQGGSGEGEALTSYVVIALHHAKSVFDVISKEYLEISESMYKSIIFLEGRLIYINDPYDVCITTYALHLVGSEATNMMFEKMESIAVLGSSVKYWQRVDLLTPPVRSFSNWDRLSSGLSIEMTSYALLTYSLRGIGTSSGLPIVRWISKQRGPNGGFFSTQDTIIGIEALTTIATALYGDEYVPMTISVKLGNFSKTYRLNKENEMLLQRESIHFERTGNQIPRIEVKALADDTTANQSTVMIELVRDYNVYPSAQVSTYNLTQDMKDTKDGYNLYFHLNTLDGKKASMTVVQIDISAGHILDLKHIKVINDVISMVEWKDDNLYLYFDTDVIDGEGVKFELPVMYGDGSLTKAKPKNIMVYNYYEQDELVATYSLPEKNFCTFVPPVGLCPYQ